MEVVHPQRNIIVSIVDPYSNFIGTYVHLCSIAIIANPCMNIIRTIVSLTGSW